MSVLGKSSKPSSSRRQIQIKGVQDGILIVPGHRYRLILETSSLNFELKSDEEQDAIIETFQGFLNALPCQLQILARIRQMDMQKYLDDIRQTLAQEKTTVYRAQIDNYTNFVQGLITTSKILSRHYYIVIPYVDSGNGGLDLAAEQLNLYADIISKGLSRLGIQTRRLDSLEVLDLFYSFYSPQLAKRQPLSQRTLHLLKQSLL